MTKSHSIDMCNGPITGKLLRFAIPLMCSSILQLLFNAADVVVVGRFCGEDSMAAVGSTTSLINLMTNLFMGLSTGANVLVARYFGAKEEKKLKSAVHTAIALGLVCGLILTLIGVLFTEKILIWMQTPETILPLASQYLRIYFMGVTSVMIYNFGNSILRAVGDTKRPLYFLFISGVINLLLNLFFVLVLKIGVAGVALATVFSQCVSAVLIIRCLCKDDETYRLSLGKVKFYKDELVKILQIGVPAGIYGTIFSLSNVVIQSSVNSFGEIVMAGSAAAMNIEGFVYVAMNSFHQAALSFTSQNYGAGRLERICPILIKSLICVIVTGMLLGQLAVIFGNELLGIYSDKAMVIESGMIRLKCICGTYALCGMMDVMVGSLRGLGKSVLPTIISLVGACGLRLIWIFTYFQIQSHHTEQVLYMSYPISWIITFMAHVVSFVIVWHGIKNNKMN